MIKVEISQLESKLELWQQEVKAKHKVILIGYPSEISHRNMDGKVGAARGPDSFREILKLTAFPSDPVD